MVRHLLTLVMLAIPSGILAAAENCDDMARQMEHTYKEMAMVLTEDFGGNSASRETNRHLKELNYQLRQILLIEHMKENRCKLDTNIGNPSHYIPAAVECAKERLREGSNLPACDMNSWVRSE